MKTKLIVAWGYISEIILSSLTLYVLTRFFSPSEISKFMHDTAGNFASFFLGRNAWWCCRILLDFLFKIG